MIIWLASYPKSGNTWIRAFISSMLFSNSGRMKGSLWGKILDKDISNKIVDKFYNEMKELNYI